MLTAFGIRSVYGYIYGLMTTKSWSQLGMYSLQVRLFLMQCHDYLSFGWTTLSQLSLIGMSSNLRYEIMPLLLWVFKPMLPSCLVPPMPCCFICKANPLQWSLPFINLLAPNQTTSWMFVRLEFKLDHGRGHSTWCCLTNNSMMQVIFRVYDVLILQNWQLVVSYYIWHLTFYV